MKPESLLSTGIDLDISSDEDKNMKFSTSSEPFGSC
jgi:hypothetical protein